MSEEGLQVIYGLAYNSHSFLHHLHGLDSLLNGAMEAVWKRRCKVFALPLTNLKSILYIHRVWGHLSIHSLLQDILILFQGMRVFLELLCDFLTVSLIQFLPSLTFLLCPSTLLLISIHMWIFFLL